MNSKKTLFIMRRAPYATSLAREALEAALAAGSFEQAISVLFMDDGVFQLLADQQTKDIAQKNHGAMLKALPMYEVDKLYVESASLDKRHISLKQLIPATIPVDTSAIQKLMAEHDHILSF